MLKQWLDAGKCLLGAHQGDWALQSPGDCRMTQICQVCGRKTDRVEHLWDVWTTADGQPCESSRTCTRCRATEERTEHQFGGWTYRNADSCEQGQRCDRCSSWSGERQIVHGWMPWEYSEQHRAPLRTCGRCAVRAPYFADQIIRASLMNSLARAADETPEVVTPPSPDEELSQRCDAILDELAVDLERDGFSEYRFREAMSAIQELPAEGIDASLIVRQSVLRLIDISVPYMPEEGRQTLMAARAGIEQQQGWDGPAGAPLTAGQVREQGEAILHHLKETLESGAFPGPALMTAMNAFTAIGQRIPEDDEEACKILVQLMARVNDVCLPYAPEGAEHSFREAKAMMDTIVSSLDVAMSEDEVGKAMLTEQYAEQMSRAAHTIDPQSIPSEGSAIAHIRRFVELLPTFMERVMSPALHEHAGEGDKAEIERLRTRVDRPMHLLRAAVSEEQFIRPQREGLRRAAVEFRQFERRHHLMVVHPAFPANAVATDPNCVFFSGSEPVGDLFRAACDSIGMTPAVTHGFGNTAHDRWQQLRESAIAVFDYSPYDPARADPQGGFVGSPDAEAAILSAAGPVAAVAYETGLAYALGKPMIIVVGRNQRVPFDIDVEPVVLEGDGADAERLVIRIQSGLYGIQHGIAGNCLAETVEYVRARYGHAADPQVLALLDAASDVQDATRVRLAIAALLNRVGGEQAMLILPAFPGRYPPRDRRRLFHVAAFRDWTTVVRDEARAACERAGIEYVVGNERIDPDILRVIWTDLCQASFVVADITNLNPNAVLELAMAQAIGRPTIILTQNSEPHRYLPAIQKIRTHHYDSTARADLAALLDTFLGTPD